MQRFILIVLAVAVGTLVLYRLERVAVVLILAMRFGYLIALLSFAERISAISEPRRACHEAWPSASSMWSSPGSRGRAP